MPSSACDLELGERLGGEVGERRAAPLGQRGAELPGSGVRVARGQGAAAVGGEALEALAVELARLQADAVAALLRLQDAVALPVRCQRAAQPADVHLQALGRGRRGLLAPQLVDQPLGGQPFVGVQQQEGEHRALLGTPQGQRLSLVARLERSEDAEVHGRPHATTVAHRREVLHRSLPACG
jgi:hypothetical protein